MKAVREKPAIQIEITNACINECANCTRFVGHHKTPYFMNLKTIEKAIDSLEGFENNVGIIGGEPTKHPQFLEICDLIRQKVPAGKRSLHTSGYKWNQYRSVIRKTFGTGVHMNLHTNLDQKHHPMLMAVAEVVPNPAIVEQLIENCWVDQRWCGSINPKGGFFCEIAAALDILFDGPGGMPIEKRWWDQPSTAFAEQRKRYCHRCGACVPFHPVLVTENQDYASTGNYEGLKLMRSPRMENNRVKLIQDRFSDHQIQERLLQWKPWQHRGEGEKKLNCYDLYGMVAGFKEEYAALLRHKMTRLKSIAMTALNTSALRQRPIPSPSKTSQACHR